MSNVSRRITIKDIAEKAQVSKATVSFAFNAPWKISEETRDRVLRVAEELDYVPDPLARTLATKRVGAIGLLLPDPIQEAFKNPYMFEVLQGIGTVCHGEDLSLTILPPVKGLQGVYRALEERNIPRESEAVQVYPVDASIESTVSVMGPLLSPPRRPTAVLCLSDVAALGVYQVCQDQHIAIPQELSVAGFDGIFFGKLLTPTLTTLSQPGYEKGQAAAALVVNLMRGLPCSDIMLPVELQIGSSVAPAPLD